MLSSPGRLNDIQEQLYPPALVIHTLDTDMEMVRQPSKSLHPRLLKPSQPMSSTERMTSLRNLEENGTRL